MQLLKDLLLSFNDSPTTQKAFKCELKQQIIFFRARVRTHDQGTLTLFKMSVPCHDLRIQINWIGVMTF